MAARTQRKRFYLPVRPSFSIAVAIFTRTVVGAGRCHFWFFGDAASRRPDNLRGETHHKRDMRTWMPQFVDQRGGAYVGHQTRARTAKRTTSTMIDGSHHKVVATAVATHRSDC